MTRPMLFPLVTVAVAALILALAGCGGEAEDTTTLDSVLTRTESLVEAGRDREARHYLRAELEMRKDIREGKAMAAGLRMLAELYTASAFYDSAHVFYDRAADAYRGLAQRGHAYEMVIAAGELIIHSGRPGRARLQYEEALRLAGVFGDSASAHVLRLALIPVYAALEDRDAERDALSRLFTTARAHQDRGGEAQIEYAAGLASACRGENDDAAAAFLRTVTLADGAGDSLLATQALMQVGITLDRKGQTREALATFGSALSRSGLLRYHTGLAGELLVRVGNLYLRQKDYAQASRFFRAAVGIAHASRDALLEAYLMVQVGHATILTDRAGAMESFGSAVEQFRSFRYAPGIVYALTSLAAVAERENRLADALQLQKAAVVHQEKFLRVPSPRSLYADCERSGAIAPGDDAAQGLVSLLLQLTRIDEAFAAQQRRNGRALMIQRGAGAFRTGNADPDSVLAFLADQLAMHRGAEYQQERVLAGAASHLSVREDILGVMTKATTAIGEAGEDLQRLAPAYASLAAIPSVTPEDIRHQVPAGSTFITFLIGRRSVSVLAITPAGSVVRVSPQPLERITRAIDDYLSLLRAQTVSAEEGKKPDPAQGLEVQALTRTLYEALILPVESFLDPGTRLFVLFPEGMQIFPLHALRRAATAGSPFLVERYPIQYLASLRFPPIGARPGTVPSQVTCLGFAGRSGWDVEYELRDVRFFFKDARMVFGREATLDVLHGIHAEVLHLALDMRFGSRSPLNGVFFVSDGTSQDGSRMLPLTTMSDLPRTGITVVSSITSGLPSFDPLVPFVIGANGTGAVVMNVFQPGRSAKKAFGEAFYTALLQGSAADEAVRKAQVELIRGKKFSTPASWAGFMVWTMN